MQPHRKIYTFKYKLSLLLFTVVLLVASLLGTFQFVFMKKSLLENFNQTKRMVRDRVVNIVRDSDYINYLLEQPIENESRRVLSEVVKKYDAEKNINFDMEPFIKAQKGMNLYIIDKTNTVIATTDSKDQDLNFSAYSDFVKFLEDVRANKVFSTSRISLSLNGEEMMKYCYMPTSDGKYIFETGTLFEARNESQEGIGFSNFDQEIIKDNALVSSVILYDYTGTSYKKIKQGSSKKMEEGHLSYFAEAMQSMNTVEFMDRFNGKKAFYQYIPYEIIGAAGANEKNTVEVIYNYSVVEDKLRYNAILIILLVLAGALISASFGFYRARSITRPIGVITEGVKQVSEGNFSYSFQVESNDEFYLLGKQFNYMTNEINGLLEERYKIEKALERKNSEILNQKEEITALYEETSALNEELESLLKQNKDSYFETVRALANAIEEKDPYTGGHCERVMDYSVKIAGKMGLSNAEIEELKFGSILHDIGKIGISESILNKDGLLTDEEYSEIKKHPEIGNRILQNLQFLNNCRKIVSEHHERIDGRGYPDGKKGGEIDFLARIVCVADAYDAMTSSRPYRKKALTTEQAINELLLNSGRQFDEKVVEVFVECLKKSWQKNVDNTGDVI